MSCMCVNGVTTCSEVHCLSTCLNQISVPGECCPVCADCVFEGHVYGPGESFHPSGDPCQICTCEVMPDGQQHLGCYRKQCPSLVNCPKHNILYSGSDSCCPVCAQPLSNCTATLIGNEVLATDDPCFTCQCKDLTWTCIHRGCPPLSCPPDDQHTPPDTCCPICDECVLEGDQTHVPNGQRWTDKENECITCICNQGHIECDLQECPPLDCPDGSVKVKNPGKCCLECKGNTAIVHSIDTGAHCVYEGQVYSHNDHWEVDKCTSCTCVSRDVHCQTQRCPTLTCASDETPALVPGMCCPHCIPHPATCIVFGDPHYRTFDGKMVNFQGTCTYVLAQDCEGGDFSVHVSNEDRGRKGVSWTKEVDYQPVSLPFLKEPYVYLERKTNNILLNTNVGLKVLWNGRSHVEVSVPGTYKKHMCGLCGNFNNYPQDDMKLRNGQIAKSEADFGNNWKVGSGNPSVHCSDVKNINPCKEAGYSARKTANARCAVLKSPVFERCHKVVPPEMFFASCVYDLCACGSNMDECLCDVLEAYSSQCREAGIILQWRSPTLCAVGCPLDRGYVFDECGPPCPKTCFNKDVPLGVIEAHCFKPCVPGCQCPAGLRQTWLCCNRASFMKINSSNKMEECLHLVCETIGVHEDDEVGVDVICSLYKSVFLITATLEDTKRAISQVRGQSGGLLCSARGVLHVLLVMEKQRENREEHVNQGREHPVYSGALGAISSESFSFMQDCDICRLFIVESSPKSVVWWDSMSEWDQTDCVCELGAFVEQAFRHRDILQLSGLPGALRCYREGQEALRVIYLSMCVAVRRAERESQSYAALLVAKQHWDRWPYMRGSASQDLARIWLQENMDPTAKKQQGWKKGNCAQQEREPEHEEPSDGEKQELCTGCGMVLDPEDTPYLEILCVKDPRNEVSMMESRDGDRKREEGDIKSKGDLEEISVEKQNSLITLAWSKPAHGENHIQELNSTQQKEKAVSIAVQEDRANNTCVLDTNPHDVNIYTHQENISTVSLQPSAQYEETHSDTEKGETQTQIQQDHSGFITAGQQQEIIRDEELTHLPLGDTHQPESTPPTASQLLQNTDTTDTSTAPASVHFPDSKSTQTFETHEMEVSLQEQRNEEICERVGEEQQLQREATMRCLVDIQRKAERRWQRDRDRQLLRVQERLAIVQTRKADEDLLGLTQEDTLRHLTDTLRQEDQQQQKTLVREKLQQMRRERSCILQTRRER
ncbi:Kielin/chordin-like protein [Anabarilius grahami]|uniref:Kielin/chordin-like protein n=1 Tax=Anabarilius grahami TaxID=495550 RepID=A0A3N0Y247_ANAGA|nr:Kielin/chordin-like protein [Anabarilius grahami]